MPQALRARSKPPGKSARRTVDEMRSMLLDIEVPLNDAIKFVHALRMIGNGLIADYDDGGEPIVAVARAASERLETLKTIWNGIHECGRRSAPDRRRRKRV